MFCKILNWIFPAPKRYSQTIRVKPNPKTDEEKSAKAERDRVIATESAYDAATFEPPVSKVRTGDGCYRLVWASDLE